MDTKPITLLCLDSKILTKILANRFKKILWVITSECLNTTENGLQELILTRELIRYTKEKKNLYILQIDKEKAFDKIDRRFLYKTLETKRICNKFISFIKILYENNTSTITNNSVLAAPLLLSRGLRQGCPLPLTL